MRLSRIFYFEAVNTHIVYRRFFSFLTTQTHLTSFRAWLLFCKKCETLKNAHLSGNKIFM